MRSSPNILLFLPDGMQAKPVNSEVCHTPNFDRIAKAGVAFSRAYTPLPTCSPARASLKTGLLAHNHGVLQVGILLNGRSVYRGRAVDWGPSVTPVRSRSSQSSRNGQYLARRTICLDM